MIFINIPLPINNKIREIKSKINSEFIKILTELTSHVKDQIKELKISEQKLAEIDYHFAKSEIRSKNKRY